MTDIKKLDLENDIVDITERNGSANFVAAKYTLFPKELIQILANCLEKAGLSGMFYNSLQCRMMTADKNGWQKGHLKMTIEFVPDEAVNPESKNELDELRR